MAMSVPLCNAYDLTKGKYLLLPETRCPAAIYRFVFLANKILVITPVPGSYGLH